MLKEHDMNEFNTPRSVGVNTDVGLRTFMMGTYRYMVLAMLVSMGVAWAFGNFVLINVPFAPESGLSGIGRMLMNPMVSLAMVVGIMFGFGGVGAKLHSMSVSGVKTFLFAFAAVMGVWLSAMAVYVNPLVVTKIFFMAATAFASVSLIGYVTKKDLGGIAKFCFMIFAGFVAYSLLSMFIPSLSVTGPMDIVINVVALVAICGITAWETQALKRTYYATAGNAQMAEKMSVFGAASLLLSFINIFSLLMNIFGGE